MDIQSLFGLDGRVALVTGGSRGIGKMFVEGLLAAGCARVYISARKVEQMQECIDEFGADSTLFKLLNRLVYLDRLWRIAHDGDISTLCANGCLTYWNGI